MNTELIQFRPNLEQHDIAKIISVLPFKLDTNSAWIAGGAARRLFNNESLTTGDIDIWFSNKNTMYAAKAAMSSITGSKTMWMTLWDKMHLKSKALEYNEVDEVTKSFVEVIPSTVTSFATSYIVKIDGVEFKIQLITRRFYQSIQTMFEDFDISVCQFATDGYTCVTTKQAVEDEKNKVLRLREGGVSRRNMISRLAKYMDYGYTPERSYVHDALTFFLSRTNYCPSKENVNDDINYAW